MTHEPWYIEPDTEPSPGRDWNELTARIVRARRRQQRDILIAIPTALAAGLAIFLARGVMAGALFDAFGSGLAVGMLFAIGAAGFGLWMISRNRDAASPGSDLFAVLHRQYQRRRRVGRTSAILLPLLSGWVAFTSNHWVTAVAPKIAL